MVLVEQNLEESASLPSFLVKQDSFILVWEATHAENSEFCHFARGRCPSGIVTWHVSKLALRSRTLPIYVVHCLKSIVDIGPKRSRWRIEGKYQTGDGVLFAGHNTGAISSLVQYVANPGT